MPRLLFVVTEDWYFVSHRLALAVEARRVGFDVVVVTRFGSHQRVIEEAGLRTIPFSMCRRGLNPVSLFWEVVQLARIFWRERPDIVHLVALRPVVVGGFAARLAGVRAVVSAVTGMGFLFTEGGRSPWARQSIQRLLPWLLSRGRTIVQNQDDAGQLSEFGVPRERMRLIVGAGVDVGRFTPSLGQPAAAQSRAPVVVMASRLLRDKGVEEYVEAARRLRNLNARFVLVGAVDTANPASVSEREIRIWESEGVVEWWGHREDMAATFVEVDIVCLPSYREGLPKVLLEAMACGKPCVTTDVPGCRDAVRQDDNGLLVPARNVGALVSALERLISNPAEGERMGRRGRQRALEEFSQERVIGETLAVYRELIA